MLVVPAFILPAFSAIFVLAADCRGRALGGSDRGAMGVALAFNPHERPVRPHTGRTSRGSGIADGEQEVRRRRALCVPPTPQATSVVLAELHSGSVRYYSGRTTIRYEWLDHEWLDRALAYLATSGFEPYLVLEKSEVARFRERFAGQASVTLVDRPPIAIHSREVFIYATGNAGGNAPGTIPHTTGCQ